MKLSLKTLQSYLLTLQVCGFPLAAGIAAILSIESTPLSVAMRLVILSLAIIIIANSIASTYAAVSSKLAFLFLLFWLFYFVRITIDTVITEAPLSRPPSDYWIWAAGACFIPAIAMWRKGLLDRIESTEKSLIKLAFASCSIVLIFGTNMMVTSDGYLVDAGRLNLQSLNPISTGHLGCTLLLLAIYRLNQPNRQLSLFEKIGLCIAILLGGMVLIKAASRGPLVSVIVCMLIISLQATSIKKATLTVAVLILFFATFVALTLTGFISLESIILRTNEASAGTDISVLGRYTAYTGAIEQFTSNPIFGNALEEKLTGFYPHNVILESLMSTGLAGGLPFVALMTIVIYISLAWTSRRLAEGWIGLLFIQYFVGAQFSGSIYLSTTMWCLCGAIIGLQFKRRARPAIV